MTNTARTQRPFRYELPRLLTESGKGSVRAFARQAKVNSSYVARVLSGERMPSAKLIEAAADYFGLDADYFRESREAQVIEQIKTDPDLLDRVYALIKKQ